MLLRICHITRFEYQAPAYDSHNEVRMRPLESADQRCVEFDLDLTPDASTLNIVTIVPGFKWNLSDTWVLAGNVSIPLTTAGLTSTFEAPTHLVPAGPAGAAEGARQPPPGLIEHFRIGWIQSA